LKLKRILLKRRIRRTVKEVVQKIFEEKRLDFDRWALDSLWQENPWYKTLSLINTDILFRWVVWDNANSSLSKKVQDIVSSPTNSHKFWDYNFNVALNNLGDSGNVNKKLVVAAELNINNILGNKEFSIGYTTGKYTGKWKATKVTNYDWEDVIYEYTGKKDQEILDIIRLSNNRNNIDNIWEKVDTKYLTMNIKINGEEVATKKYTKYNNWDNPILTDVKNRMIKALGGNNSTTFDEALDIPFNTLSFQEVANLYLERRIRNSGVLNKMKNIDEDISFFVDNVQKKKTQFTMENLWAIIWLEKKIKGKIRKIDEQLNTAILGWKTDFVIESIKIKKKKLENHLKNFNDSKEQIDLIKLLLNWEKDAFVKNEALRMEKKFENGTDKLVTTLGIQESPWSEAKFEAIAIFPEIVEYKKLEWEINWGWFVDVSDWTFKIKEDYANKYTQWQVIERFYPTEPFYPWTGTREFWVWDSWDAFAQYIYQYWKGTDFSEIVTTPNYQLVVKWVKPDGTEGYFKFEINYDKHEYWISEIKEAHYLWDLTHGTSFNSSWLKNIEAYKEGLKGIVRDKWKDVIPKKELKNLEKIIEKSDEVGC